MMFRALTLITLFTAALHVGAFAVESELGGVFSGYLKKEKSPYLVKETLVVPEGKALLVEPGVVLHFAEGAGLDVRGGSLAVVGEVNNPVLFTSAEENRTWNGISITGVKRSEVQYLRVRNAEFGFAVESGALELRDVVIDKAQRAAVFARNGSVDVQWSKIQNSKNVGVWATQSAEVNLDGTNLSGNRIAVVAMDGSALQMQRSKLQDNEVAILDFGDNRLSQRNTLIEGNGTGVVSRDLPSEEIRRALSKNKAAVDQNLAEYESSLGDEPRNPYADGMKLYAMFNDVNEDNSWKISGNLGLDLGYHKVLTKHNHSGEDYVFGSDTIKTGERYKNYFQVPGLFANWSASMMMESPTGQVIEFTADFSNDSWDKFKVHTLQASYTDEMQRLILGDFAINAGAIYLEGVNAFGGMYELGLFKNAANEPLFVGTIFGGEVRAPKVVGDRNFDVYNEYIEDGDAEAQNMVAGGRVRWNMHRRFNGTLGFIGSKDYLSDPILRDGQSENVNTVNPLVTSRNFFADGNWLVFPGDIKLNGQVAFGAADTANLAKIRAVNQVFSGAGLDASNYSLLNKLMKNPKDVNRLTLEQLESIFGASSSLTPSEMRAELRNLLDSASRVAKTYKVENHKPSNSDFWDYNHLAVAGSYEWSNENTFIEGFLKYVGREYYSAGSPDQVQNARMVGGNLRQNIFDFWKLRFGYMMNVENAANESTGYNIFGMGEGTKWGLFSGADEDWLEEHDQDENRTLYIHDAYLGNDFKLNDKIDLSIQYSVNYRTRSTAQRLYANYMASSGVFDDDWFKARKGAPTLDLIENGDTTQIDSARWAKYYSLSNQDYLASQFDEKLLKHTVQVGATFKLPKNVLKLGWVLNVRRDYSEFVQDSLIRDLDLSNETFGILGYYFHGSDFTENRFPVSLTTSIGEFKNTLSATPRYKSYVRNNMTELEWILNESMKVPMMDQLLELSLNGGLRQNWLDYEVDDEKYSESELDIDGAATLRINHSNNLYTEWTFGSVFNYRPDSRADQYKDIYGIASLNYSF